MIGPLPPLILEHLATAYLWGKHRQVLCLQLSIRTELGVQLQPAGSHLESGGKVKIQLVTGTLPLLCGCVQVLSKRRVSGERPVLAVAPGPVRESGVGSQLHQWTSPGNLLPSLPGREVSLCQRGVG